MIRLLAACLALCAALPAAMPAWAAEKLTVVCNASVQFAPLFYAQQSGLFARHGLDVSVQMIGLNSNIPPLLVSGSAQLGGTTSTVLLQGVDAGLDLVAVAGAGVADATTHDAALLVRPNLALASPADLAGKTIGVPGIGAVLDVLFRNWLIEQHVDPARLRFVETDLAQQMEALRGGSVDAVIGNNPSMQRIISAGDGRVYAWFTEALPATIPMVVYAATRDWVAAHGPALAAFRAANAEAVSHVLAQPEDGRAAMGAFVKMAPEVLKDVTMPLLQEDVRAAQMQVAYDMMRRQDMLHTQLDMTKLVAP